MTAEYLVYLPRRVGKKCLSARHCLPCCMSGAVRLIISIKWDNSCELGAPTAQPHLSDTKTAGKKWCDFISTLQDEYEWRGERTS